MKTLENSKERKLSYNILLNTTDNAIKFVKEINSIDGYFDIAVGSYLIDAKSLLGVLSLDPRRVMTLQVVRNDDNMDELNKKLEPFCVG